MIGNWCWCLISSIFLSYAQTFSGSATFSHPTISAPLSSSPLLFRARCRLLLTQRLVHDFGQLCANFFEYFVFPRLRYRLSPDGRQLSLTLTRLFSPQFRNDFHWINDRFSRLNRNFSKATQTHELPSNSRLHSLNNFLVLSFTSSQYFTHPSPHIPNLIHSLILLLLAYAFIRTFTSPQFLKSSQYSVSLKRNNISIHNSS